MDELLPNFDAAKRAKADANIVAARALTEEQRDRLIVKACETAMMIERSKIESGLPPSRPAPWPASTWEFLRRSERIKQVTLNGAPLCIWDAETLAVFKMMFFRRKDLADIEQILIARRSQFDAAWVRTQIESMYGSRDPQLASWDELVADTIKAPLDGNRE